MYTLYADIYSAKLYYIVIPYWNKLYERICINHITQIKLFNSS